jgi:hypothetical protein
MKKLFFPIVAGVLFSASATAQDLPMPSPHAEVEQTIGLTEVEVEYSRPSTKGREIWGELVPYGEIWRTGANKNTTIEFSTDVKIAGTDVKKGEYALFLSPNEDLAVLHLNTVTDGWGTGKYADSNDVAKAEVKFEKSDLKIETMLFYFDNVKSGSADLVLAWANRKVIIPIEVDYVNQSLMNIEKAIEEDGKNFRVYNNAASFFLDNNIEPTKAVEYAKMSVSLEEKFWNVSTLSKAYAANKQYEEAIKYAKQSLNLAKEADYMPYVKMNEENIKKWSKM